MSVVAAPLPWITQFLITLFVAAADVRVVNAPPVPTVYVPDSGASTLMLPLIWSFDGTPSPTSSDFAKIEYAPAMEIVTDGKVTVLDAPLFNVAIVAVWL